MPTYGVIDLGSNSIRLVIYEVKDDRRSTYSSKDFKSIINDKVMAGLAAFVEDGVFTPDGVDRAVNVLKSHMKRVRYFARCSTPLERGTLVDIGGGSTELTRVEGGRDSDDVSLGQGSLSSFARFVRNILPAPIEMNAIACEFRGNLRKLPSLEPYKAPTLYGVGGSTRAAAKLVQQLDELQTRPREIQAEQVLQILRACHENPSAFGHAALKASAERVHTMVPGCVILAELFRHLGADKLVVCKHGVREGYLIERMLGAVSAPPQAD